MSEEETVSHAPGTVVVAGGAGVMGTRLAAILRDEGVRVVVWDKQQVGTGVERVVDLTSANAVREAMTDLVADFPAPYRFIMVQGAHEMGTLEDLLRGEGFPQVMAANFSAVVNIVVAATTRGLPSCRFVLLGSIAAKTPIPFSTIYSASKSAAEVFMESAGYELELQGHSWCIVDVGGVNTGFNELGHGHGLGPIRVTEAYRRVAERIHSRNGVEPEAVARRLAHVALATRARRHYTIGRKAVVAAAVSRVGGMRGRRLLVMGALLRSGSGNGRGE